MAARKQLKVKRPAPLTEREKALILQAWEVFDGMTVDEMARVLNASIHYLGMRMEKESDGDTKSK
jgi:hypothetical protein